MITARHDPYFEPDRFPPGARPAGSVVCLRVSSSDRLASVRVRLWRSGGEEQIPMREVIRGVFEATVNVGSETGPLWYYFILRSESGETAFLGKPVGGSCAVYACEPPSFQITVYDPAFETPAWMRSGVMMQIMVDRFAVGAPGPIKPHGRGAYLHTDWYEPPHLCKNGSDEESVDFFGGNLNGIREKLPYLQDLGIGILYLNPIFKARSNHKYDTGDYLCIDPSFGTESDFRALCGEAASAGIRIVLDGVFSHTGADSRYFNKFSTYPSPGAYNAYEASPYSSWYRFLTSRDDYDCWWGIPTLPNVNEVDPSYLDYIIRGPDSVIGHYLRCGASGWRLDVADELPMEFIRALRLRAKRENPNACVIGEVWEDVTNKLAYGRTRCYAAGDTLDSAMNYPLRDHLIAFLTGLEPAPVTVEFLCHQMSTLPAPMYYSMMNLLGSHDKPRILNVLAGQTDLEPEREKRAFIPLSRPQYELGKARFLKAFDFICHMPGMPCLYYGDEAGLTGMGDPFCRRTYPWGREDTELTSAVRGIIRHRNSSPALKTGSCRFRAPDDDRIEITRESDTQAETYILDRRL